VLMGPLFEGLDDDDDDDDDDGWEVIFG
jgi:hypothetical protein